MCSKRKKDVNVKTFNMTTNKHEAKTMTKHIACDFKCKSNSTTFNQIKNGIIKHANASAKIIITVKIL